MIHSELIRIKSDKAAVSGLSECDYSRSGERQDMQRADKYAKQNEEQPS